MAAPPIAERHKHHFHQRSPIKESVRVATTADITIATALNVGDVIDGVTLADQDRVLVKSQSTQSGNGIYLAGASPTRDYDVSTDDPAFGYLVYVREGTVNGGTVWANTNTSAPTIGSTSITFASAAGGSGAPTTADYLVGTAQGGLSAEIVVGTTPGGELGGTWASPTVDATHAGSTHIALSSATPIVESGAGSAGSGTAASKDDHVHPAAGGSGTLSTVEEVDGSPTDSAVTKLVFPNGTLAIASHVATYTPAGGGGGSGALVLLEQHTASSSATLDFTTFISSTYDEYQIEFVNLIPATNDVALRMLMGTGGGPTYDTGNNYGWGVYIFRGGGTSTAGNDSGVAFISLTMNPGGTLGMSNGTTYGYNGHLRLFSPQSTSLHKVVAGLATYQDAEPFRISTTTFGGYLSTTAVTAVQFYMSSGNIASGTIRIYGIAK